MDWTDVESFARPPFTEGAHTADPEASWGHRRGDGPGQKDELFYGFFLQLATMVHEESGAAVPELVRRLLLTSCHVDPPPAFVAVMEKMVASGVALGDVLADSGYAHRIPSHWALPLRALRADLVMDLHPHDRGTQGTHHGAICWNGNLYCPATPNALFTLESLSRAQRATPRCWRMTGAAPNSLATSSGGSLQMTPTASIVSPVLRCWARCAARGEPRRWHCPMSAPRSSAPPKTRRRAVRKRLSRSPRASTPRPAKSTTTRAKPIASPMGGAARPSVPTPRSKTPPPTTSPAAGVASWGWPLVALMLTCLFVVRNQRVLASFETRVAEEQRRQAVGLAPRTRRRRRQTISDMVTASAAPP